MNVKVPDARLVQWTEQGNVFELQSRDAELLEMASRVFAVQVRDVDGPASRSWQVRRLPEGEGDAWIVSGHSAASSMISAACTSREMCLQIIEQDALDWLLQNARESVAVHGALLSNDSSGIAIVGPSFAGKSTLATALWRAGWLLMSDDLVFIDSKQCVASPAPRRVSLRLGSRELVGDSVWSEIRNSPSCVETQKGLFFHPHEVTGKRRSGTAPLSAIFFLGRREAEIGEAQIRKINPARAAISLLPYAFNIRTLPFIEGIRRIAPLLRTVPAYDLGRGNLGAMVDAVESLIVQ